MPIMKNSIILLIAVLFVLTGWFAGCAGDTEVQTYSVPKKGPPAGHFPEGHPLMEGSFPKKQTSFQWKTPKGWTEKAPSTMRLGSFSIPGKGKVGDASIVILKGKAGGMAANVNRWRQQAGLQPLSENEIKKQAHKEKGKLGTFHWFKIVNPQNLDNAILVAMIPRVGQTIFVKLVGPKNIIEANSKKFVGLCRSIH